MLDASENTAAVRISDLLDDAQKRLAAAGVDSAALDAQLMLAGALGVERTTLLAGNLAVSAQGRLRFESMVARRVVREPLAYILGRREFYSMEFEVTPEVLIPRPETETLVDAVIEHVKPKRFARILDIGTGPGTIAVAVAANAPQARVVATDVSEAALRVARRNAVRHGFSNRIDFVLSNCLEATKSQGLFDAIVSNPPYVIREEIAALPPEIRDFEPRIALDGGLDGLDFYRQIAANAGRHLLPEGILVLEVGDGQDRAVQNILAGGGFCQFRVLKDLEGRARAVVARR